MTILYLSCFIYIERNKILSDLLNIFPLFLEFYLRKNYIIRTYNYTTMSLRLVTNN